MLACTRCGRLHTDAEKAAGKRLSCTEAKQCWAKWKADHQKNFGHYPALSFDGDDNWICLKCGRRINKQISGMNL